MAPNDALLLLGFIWIDFSYSQAARMSAIVKNEEPETVGLDYIPRNKGPSLHFSTLITELLFPLKRDFKSISQITKQKPNDMKRDIIARFYAKWRAEVGDNFYPLFRLLMPDKDRERQMYGLKENALGKLIIKLVNIPSDSADAKSIQNWKQGQKSSAGDFAERCYEVIRKRSTKIDYGSLTVDEVNEGLDRLSKVTKSNEQLEVIKWFYDNMNADEMKWLINIILRYMHLGATERTFLNVFHPEAMSLFNVTSNLKRVCYELYDPAKSLSQKSQEISLMSCFQPQLAQFQKHSYDKIVEIMPSSGFYIEEKIDGERMQMHMDEYGAKFGFWSRKAKDYTYLYGSSLDDAQGSLTKHLKHVFLPNVKSCILDGEMVAYDPDNGTIIPFGTLKTAAIAEAANSGTMRPMFMVFDLVYLNGKPLVNYPLKERKAALRKILQDKEGYIKVLPFVTATKADEIFQQLKYMIENSCEGVVVKNPLAKYKVNERNDSWIKVKPEYMAEYGENLDLCIIGGYYGQGKRGRRLAAFLCGLRASDDPSDENFSKFWSFCRVGGGFTAADYDRIQLLTEGQWNEWGNGVEASQYMELGGPNNSYERPDLWIKPIHSVVIEIKASQVITSTQYRVGMSLRFPRFRKLREDKDWKSALSLNEFLALRGELEAKREAKKTQEQAPEKRRSRVKRRKREFKAIQFAGKEDISKWKETFVFQGHYFYILSDMVKPKRVLAKDLENIVRRNGGTVVHDVNVALAPGEQLFIISDLDVVKVVTLLRKGVYDIIRPSWILDCVERGMMIPIEPSHIHYGTPELLKKAQGHVDKFGDSFAIPVTEKGLCELLERIQLLEYPVFEEMDNGLREVAESYLPLEGLTIYIDYTKCADSVFKITPEMRDEMPSEKEIREGENLLFKAEQYCRFLGAQITSTIHTEELAVVVIGRDKSRLQVIRKIQSLRKKPARVVTTEWAFACYKSSIRAAAEDFAVL